MKIFEKTEIILVVAILIPLIFVINMDSFKWILELALGVVMFFSIRPFFKHEFNIKSKFKDIINSILLNYVLLSMVYVLLAYIILGPENPMFLGYILIGLVPPAIAIIPLCYLTKCDSEAADAAIFGAYLLSLIIIPVGVYLFFGKTVDIGEIIKIILILIIVPTTLSYLSRESNSKIFNYSKIITNICLGIVIFTAISLNRVIFFNFSNDIFKVYLINSIAIFGTGIIVYYIANKYIEHDEAINYSLYASQKNVGTAITLSIMFFSPLAAIPAIIALVMQFIYFLFLEKIILKIH